jgi:hypothetical protein
MAYSKGKFQIDSSNDGTVDRWKFGDMLERQGRKRRSTKNLPLQIQGEFNTLDMASKQI